MGRLFSPTAMACALPEGTSRLVQLAPPDQLPPARAGVVTAPVNCASEGSLEVFIEPRFPPPHLVVGRPLVRALATKAQAAPHVAIAPTAPHVLGPERWRGTRGTA